MSASGKLALPGSMPGVVPTEIHARQEYIAAAVLKYNPSLSAMVMRIVGDVVTTEDIIQETAICACKNASFYDGKSDIGGWLSGIAFRVATDYAKKSSEARFEPLETSNDWQQLPVFHTHASPLEHTLRNERDVQLRNAIGNLPDYQRAVVNRVLEGDNVAEAARQLGITEGQARHRYRSAQTGLRQLLKP